MKYEVTIARTGVVFVSAESSDEAKEIAQNFLGEKDVCWTEDWSAADAIQNEDIEDALVVNGQ